jgi:hypothetical protein
MCTVLIHCCIFLYFHVLFAAKLMALICVKCDYPRTPTVFCLQLNWHGEHDAGNNDAIRVSIRYQKLWGRNCLWDWHCSVNTFPCIFIFTFHYGCSAANISAVLHTFQHLTSVVNLLGDGFTHSQAHTYTQNESQDVSSKNYKSLTNLSMETKYDEHVP